MANAIPGSVQQQHCRLLLPLLYQLVVLCSEFGDDSDDDSYHGDDREDREKWKRRKFILNEFRRRNRVSIYIFETRIFTLITPARFLHWKSAPVIYASKLVTDAAFWCQELARVTLLYLCVALPVYVH